MFAELFTMMLLGIWKISLVVFVLMIVFTIIAVSYTHLTLPTILLV